MSGSDSFWYVSCYEDISDNPPKLTIAAKLIPLYTVGRSDCAVSTDAVANNESAYLVLFGEDLDSGSFYLLIAFN